MKNIFVVLKYGDYDIKLTEIIVSSNTHFGQSVSSAGDVNGDGYSDVIVGAPTDLNSAGKVYIYFGGINMDTTADLILIGEGISNTFGYSVSGAGDVNNDGYDDIIVGCYTHNQRTGR